MFPLTEIPSPGLRLIELNFDRVTIQTIEFLLTDLDSKECLVCLRLRTRLLYDCPYDSLNKTLLGPKLLEKWNAEPCQKTRDKTEFLL